MHRSLTEQIEALPKEYREGITDASVKLGELVKSMLDKSLESADYVVSQYRQRQVAEALSDSKGGKIDSDIFEDLLKKMTEV